MLGDYSFFRGVFLMNDFRQLPSVHATKLFLVVGEVFPPEGALVSGEETSDTNTDRNAHGIESPNVLAQRRAAGLPAERPSGWSGGLDFIADDMRQ